MRKNAIKFVYRPGRSHGIFDYTLLLDLVKKYEGKYKYVISVSEVSNE